MNDTDLIDRRRIQRRQMHLGSPEAAGERRTLPQNALEKTAPSPTPNKDVDQRSGKDRRVAERRQQNLGPPAGTGERRFRPDLRGVVFPIYYNFN